ncbi:hypothetical protein G6F48_012551 [Rhizopus delemar]|nr:hypothetical protein G6F48_012551 [Rhizopus delemar]KAG1628281.1 hypothetical protein G6F44_011953 [Rhizopus delemar]
MKTVDFSDSNKSKRKCIDDDLQGFLKKQQKTADGFASTKGCAVTTINETRIANKTEYYNKETKTIVTNEIKRNCPICNEVFLNAEQSHFEHHVHQCLDRSEEEKSQKSQTTNLWSKLFGTTRLKVRGIWSAKDDSAPGLNKSESAWFGRMENKRIVPYYKYLAGTNLVVDAFSFGRIPECEGYFLSHFHGDHYTNLNAGWTHGPIYCSEITSRLVQKKLRVPSNFIRPLPLNKSCLIPGTDNVSVTLIDANHCPGAVMFLCVVPQTDSPPLRYLHTGDFRACKEMCLHPLLKQPENPPIDILYLDTTYLDHKYSFPSQTTCIQLACDVVERHINHNGDNQLSNMDHLLTQKKELKNKKIIQKTVVVVGTYSLGKERIFIRIAKKLKSKIFVTDRKMEILSCFGDDELMKMLTDEPKEAQVHVIPLGHILPENLEAYIRSLQPHFTQMVAFKPTGWTFRTSSLEQDRSLDAIISAGAADMTVLKSSYESLTLKIYEIPYSEHSSFRELALFIASLDIRRIVPTVNVHNEKSRAKMGSLFDRWQKEKKKMAVVDYPSLDHW